jgi:2-C-methyl-D-erythritol 4-phosphate cytidylyltransferase/2-C-methyl-D-erythritol 2,4-cyclodiphosphate synthase
MQKIIALIVAAGRGSRFGEGTPKQYHLLRGKMILTHTVEAFLSHPEIDAVKVVIHPDDVELYEEAVKGLDVLPHCFGGKDRQESVRFGLEAIEKEKPEFVLIHDAARPFVSHQVISNVIEPLNSRVGVVPVIPVTDTIKKVAAGSTSVSYTIDRSVLWRAQTPQGFVYKDILISSKKTRKMKLTDDAAAAETCGIKVVTVKGSTTNIKITTLEDLEMANRADMGVMVRVGAGFDVHAFTKGEEVTLCGVKIPYEKALLGHSDADVALHALADAIYGAIGGGDIGMHFPPSDEQWKDADSSIFVKHAADMVREKKGQIINADITIICEAPKIGQYRAEMVGKVSLMLGIPETSVNVKGTTTEGLGFTGRGEGIAAKAVVSVLI